MPNEFDMQTAFGIPIRSALPENIIDKAEQKETREERLIRLRYEQAIKQEQQKKKKKEKQENQQKVEERMEKEPEVFQVGNSINQAFAVAEVVGGFEGSSRMPYHFNLGEGPGLALSAVNQNFPVLLSTSQKDL